MGNYVGLCSHKAFWKVFYSIFISFLKTLRISWAAGEVVIWKVARNDTIQWPSRDILTKVACFLTYWSFPASRVFRPVYMRAVYKQLVFYLLAWMIFESDGVNSFFSYFCNMCILVTGINECIVVCQRNLLPTILPSTYNKRRHILKPNK